MAKRKTRPVGRPRTEMTDENIAAILRTVALGVWPDRAAQMHGVSADAMRKHKERHPDFVTAIEKAEAQAESGYLSKILRHTEKQWTAAAWMLERRWGDRWAQRQKLEHSGNPDAPVVVEHVGPTPPQSAAEIRTWAAKLAAMAGDAPTSSD